MVFFKKMAVFLLIGLFLTGCVKSTANSGYITKFARVGELNEGKTNREGVLKIMGSPSSKASFGKETWYYVSIKTEHAAFLDTKVVDQDVVSITFNDTGIDRYGLSDGRRIKFAEDFTPTEGNTFGVVEQLLGNLGRFNTEQGGGVMPGN